MKRNQRLFAVALLGVLAMVGLVLGRLSVWAGLGWAILASAGVGVLAWRSRPVRQAEGRTCTCCTSTVYDPVEVR